MIEDPTVTVLQVPEDIPIVLGTWVDKFRKFVPLSERDGIEFWTVCGRTEVTFPTGFKLAWPWRETHPLTAATDAVRVGAVTELSPLGRRVEELIANRAG